MAASMAEERNAGLDGLRGYAAIVVVIFHSVLGLDATQIERILRGRWSNFDPYEVITKIFLKIFDGEAAVMLFFVLSGAVLFRSLMREEDGIGGVAVKFYVRRVFRIYPALFVCPLERDGLVDVRVSKEDRRSRDILLTRKGRSLLDKAYPLWRNAHDSFEQKHGARFAEQFRSVLSAVTG